MAAHSLSYPPAAGTNDASSPDVLVFFISGNPGLIDYYEPFFSSLRQLIDSSSVAKSTRFHIYGQDLAGFDDNDHKPFNRDNRPHDVEYQIAHSLESLSSLRIDQGPKQGKPYDDVLLIGHSVGSYIALQIFHKLLKDKDLAPHLNLKLGIMLFPTIEHISHSPQGQKLDFLRRTPLLGPNAHAIAQGFLRLFSYNALHWIVSTILHFPPHAAAVTTGFLKSRDGVWQALHMGMDEMQVIGEDKWDDELWEIADEAQAHDQPLPKFFFFFGKDDDWVANHLRDAFIEKRSKRVERTRIVVDEGSIPHAFCIRHSETVAEKVLVWISETYGRE
ncbi:hypothetical protein BJ170DRAFT_68671 [Xylariales sp. AK1849]|nr:hypothetical protein BJ170DRAFT_68671 [Xylariales sp. AK1849]